MTILQDQVGIVWYCHEHGEGQQSQESVGCNPEIGDFKLYVFLAEVFRCPKGHGKEDPVDGSCCCPGDYAMEGSPTNMQQGSR
jgi:hypothetical protein